MRTSDLSRRTGIRPLRYPPGGVPHATLEINRTCNIRCRSCYNLSKSQVKSLEEVRTELDLLLEKRNLGVVTILGGEPTLHPDLPEIVAAVKGRGLRCQLLTNGVVFLEDPSDRPLDELIRAGVDRFIVHIDSGQAHVHGDIEAAREAVFSKLERKMVNFALSVTVYNQDAGGFPDLVRRYSRFRYFDGVLAVLARDPLPPKIQDVELADEYRHIRSDLGVEPAAYIPSSLGDETVCWLLYSYFLDPRTGRAIAVSPLLNRIARKFYRWAFGRHLFVAILNPALAVPLFVLAGLADSILRPKTAPAFWKLMAAGLGDLRFQLIVIQTPPEIDEEARPVAICHQCPDATIRNGRLMPVCLADFISPLDGVPGEAAYEELAGDILAHLGEIAGVA